MNDYLARARARFACHSGGSRTGAFIAIAAGIAVALASANRG